MEKRKCELCLELKEEVHMTCLEEFGTLKKLYLCEKCYDKVSKPFKDRGNYEEH